MIGYDFGMHRAGVFLHLLLLACRAVVAVRPKAGAPARSARDVSAVRSPCESPTAQVRSRLWLKCVFAFRLVVGQAPRLPAGKHGNRSGCPTNSTRLRLLYASERRSVSEKALLQDQFSERKCAGWSGVE